MFELGNGSVPVEPHLEYGLHPFFSSSLFLFFVFVFFFFSSCTSLIDQCLVPTFTLGMVFKVDFQGRNRLANPLPPNHQRKWVATAGKTKRGAAREKLWTLQRICRCFDYYRNDLNVSTLLMETLVVLVVTFFANFISSRTPFKNPATKSSVLVDQRGPSRQWYGIIHLMKWLAVFKGGGIKVKRIGAPRSRVAR